VTTKVACYDVIHDQPLGPFSLEAGGDKDSNDLALEVGSIHAATRTVLSFVLRPKKPDNLKFKITITNGSGVKFEDTWTTSNPDWSVIQEVIPGDTLTNSGNKMRIEVMSGKGQLWISDIVLMFMKSIN
jgi:hypothetical protein